MHSRQQDDLSNLEMLEQSTVAVLNILHMLLNLFPETNHRPFHVIFSFGTNSKLVWACGLKWRNSCSNFCESRRRYIHVQSKCMTEQTSIYHVLPREPSEL